MEPTGPTPPARDSDRERDPARERERDRAARRETVRIAHAQRPAANLEDTLRMIRRGAALHGTARR